MENQKRMNYFHRCSDCGRMFEGFKLQDTCWICVAAWLKLAMMQWKGKNEEYIKKCL
jgi:rRNA maturation endonuclease Nob1